MRRLMERSSPDSGPAERRGPGAERTGLGETALSFADRHLGPSGSERALMIERVGLSSLDELIGEVVPEAIRFEGALELPQPLAESAALERLERMMGRNLLRRPFIGRGYYGTVTPPVIQRCVLENPGWYTAYTPYQAEIAQGRLEALLNFQTLVCDLVALPVANASLLDEATAAAEAMAMAAAAKPGRSVFVADAACYAQTLAVLDTRAKPLGIDLRVADAAGFDYEAVAGELIGVLLPLPRENGELCDWSETAGRVAAAGGLVVATADLLALTLLRPPGEWGADIAVGSAQRFGVPLGFGGPHAAYIACTDALKRRLPGRLVGVSRDAEGRPALRLALQTREQHIRREKATSNICTAQVLLAVMAGFYAVYHGPGGLRRLAGRLHRIAAGFAEALRRDGWELDHGTGFDTVTVRVPESRRAAVLEAAESLGIVLRADRPDAIGVSFDEAALESGDWPLPFEAFGLDRPDPGLPDGEAAGAAGEGFGIPPELVRESAFLEHEVFHRYRSETELMRYLKKLEDRDIALNRSMIPLGSCTMKLNAAAEMRALSWPSVSGLHPFVPPSHSEGYREMIDELEAWLAEITGFAAVSVQPNAGSQGEYAGLLAIRRYHEERGEPERRVCLIPTLAHGTNPASAAMAGFEIVAVACDAGGNIDFGDLRAKAEAHAPRLGALMVTYPSTHGVFEEGIVEICEAIHAAGGQVYLDGANLNAMVGLCRPGDIGADVCHLNLHKTFCIPHGGGGPGVGPIGVASHLAPCLPGHPEWAERPGCAVSAAPWGSASILTISWVYLAMMGPELRRCSETAILSANYLAERLAPYYPVLYRGTRGRVAHECILDLRGFRASGGVEVEDVAKRLMDFGYHAPTMSWPVPGTLMIEPTESESLAELERFCEAMIAIHGEILAIAEGRIDPANNPLKRAPHPAAVLLDEGWSRPYTREEAAYPLPWVREWKYWPPVSRIDNVHGDRHLVCSCEGMEAYT